jgi:sensor histidine kinase YesM
LKIFDYNTPVLNFKYVNIDSDSDMEVLYLSDYFKVINLCDDDFSKIISLPNDVGYNGFDAQIIKNEKDTNYVFLTGNKKSKVIKYYKNSLYFLSFIFPLLVSLFFYIIIYYAVKRRERAIQQKHQQEKALIEAQLKIANKQMSPHFQLNVLNAIGYLFENDREKAQYYLGKYSRLVSNTMMNVDKITTTLENELEFTRNYLTLEQLRLDFKFDFDIKISDEVDMSIQIPRMLVFTFCENAVKHGLFHKKEKGNLRVELTGEGKNMEIKIEDNGIGRRKAGEQKTRGTGMGLKTLNKIVNHYNKMGNYKISFVINDLTDNSGTAVIIKIRKTR